MTGDGGPAAASVAAPAEVGTNGGPDDVGTTRAPEADAGGPEADAGGPEADAGGGQPAVRPGGGPVLRTALVSSVTLDLPAQHPTVVLREVESPWRQLQFHVGLPDGTALAYAVRRIDTPRPLTHELLGDILAGFDIDVVAVRLVGRQQGTYFAELDLQGRTGRRVLSCRPSDALVVALRQAVPAPILVAEALFDGEGDVLP